MDDDKKNSRADVTSAEGIRVSMANFTSLEEQPVNKYSVEEIRDRTEKLLYAPEVTQEEYDQRYDDLEDIADKEIAERGFQKILMQDSKNQRLMGETILNKGGHFLYNRRKDEIKEVSFTESLARSYIWAEQGYERPFSRMIAIEKFPKSGSRVSTVFIPISQYMGMGEEQVCFESMVFVGNDWSGADGRRAGTLKDALWIHKQLKEEWAPKISQAERLLTKFKIRSKDKHKFLSNLFNQY